jgi:hypothetical protein
MSRPVKANADEPDTGSSAASPASGRATKAAGEENGEAGNISRFRQDIEGGQDWTAALVDAMARWTAPEDTHRGRRLRFFISGEAFDWPLLAQRLCSVANDLIPGSEREDLLLRGQLPDRLAPRSIGDLMKERLGVDKYRGYLNFHYGVTVEEALLHAVEAEVRKRNVSGGARYRTDETEEAFERLYGAPRDQLVAEFRADTGARLGKGMSLRQGRELTYWLFGYRVKHSDQAKMASDTKKGLDQMARLAAQAQMRRRRD